jgi:hypothetical protein
MLSFVDLRSIAQTLGGEVSNGEVVAPSPQRWRPLIEFAGGAKEARRQFLEKALAAIHAFVEQGRVATV